MSGRDSRRWWSLEELIIFAREADGNLRHCAAEGHANIVRAAVQPSVQEGSCVHGSD